MPKTKTYTVFQYDELTDKARDKARDWYRQVTAGDNDFAESVIEDFVTIAEILGVSFETGKGSSGQAIYWSGFSSQGDGACFAGYWYFAPGAAAAIAEYAPTDQALATIARDLATVQAKYSSPLSARLRHTGRDVHQYSVSITTETEDGTDLAGNDHEAIADSLRALMAWLYRSLESAYNDSQADETIAENIRANSYDFNEDGTRHSCR